MDTYFIDENPQLFMFKPSQNRAQKLINYLGQVLVNGPATPLATAILPADVTPYIPPVPLGECGYCWCRRTEKNLRSIK